MNTAFDHSLFHFINQGLANPVLDVLCPILRNKYTWVPFYIIGSTWLIYKYKWNGFWMIVAAVVAVGLSDLSSNLIKIWIHRLRPCHTEVGVRLLIAQCSDTFSFTSNHAANHFALSVFVSLLFRRWWLSVLMLLWASSVAFSQVYVGIHYPVDVIAGAVLGAVIGWVVFKIFTLWSMRRDK